MKRSVIPTVFLLSAIILSAQVTSDFSLTAQPVVHFPLGPMIQSATPIPLYSPVAGGLSIKAEYTLPFAQFIYVGAVFDADWIPTYGFSTSLVSLSIGPELGLQFFPVQRLAVRIAGYGGLYAGIVTAGVVRDLFAVGLADVSYMLNPSLSLGAGVQYRMNFYPSGIAYQGLGVNVGVRWNIGAESGKAGLHVTPEILPVFPLFYTYYDKNPLGHALIKNQAQGPIENVTVSFLVKQFMDQPKTCWQAGELKRGQEVNAPVYAIFNPSIFGVTEGTKTAGEIIVSYRYLGNDEAQSFPVTVTVNNRNGMTWDDTNKASAFVTAKDPALLAFAKKVAADAKSRANPAAFNATFRTAMALFQAMGTHGIGYTPDPAASYATLSESKEAVDYLQFPVQTFTYKGGDCDDLSILYAAMLESVGIRTAFITVPGHIYMAFDLEKSPSEARSFFANPDDLIIQGKSAWMPVEITLIKGGFLKAWKEGAKEWRSASSNGSAGFFPIRDGWKTYDPVGVSVVQNVAAPPDSEKVFSSFSAELKSFINSDMKPRVDALVKQLGSEPENIGLLNKLGVLYARFGMLSQAQERFLAVTKLAKDVPASTLTNLGNISYMNAKYPDAAGYFRKALVKSPESSVALLGLILSAYEMGDKDTVDVTLKALAKVDPETAAKYGYLGSGSGSAGRAASAEREISMWGE